jgi:hypothetical protein
MKSDGIVIGCADLGCTEGFHPQCGIIAGNKLRLEDELIFCTKHSSDEKP